MSDDLLRRFQDKIRGRSVTRRRRAGDAPDEDAPAPGAIRIRDLRHGLFPDAIRHNARFVAGVPRLRLTLDIGAALRSRPGPLSPEETEALLGLCPRLRQHQCGDGVHELLSPVPARDAAAGARRADGGGATAAPARPEPETADGLPLAHLIEHAAIDLLLATSRAARCSGATCAHADRLDRFDIFLECPDPLLGRAVAVLAAAAVRDVCSGKDRLALHGRCRDLLAWLSLEASARHGSAGTAPEDAAARFGWTIAEASKAMDAVARLGYLDSVAAAYTFSAPSGILYRRATAAVATR